MSVQNVNISQSLFERFAMTDGSAYGSDKMRVVEQLLHWDKRDEARSVNEPLRRVVAPFAQPLLMSILHSLRHKIFVSLTRAYLNEIICILTTVIVPCHYRRYHLT